jgi:predicted MFS family arabinose efflux permease
MSTQAPADPTADSRLALATICVAAFLAAMNYFVAPPFYVDMADDLETTVPLLGQLVTVMLLVSAALGILVGPLADRYGIRGLLALGTVAIAVNLLGTATAPSYLLLLPLAIIGALGDALVFGLAFALASALFDGEARRRAIGWAMAAVSIGPVVGVPALTTVGGLWGWRFAYASAGLFAVAVTWMALTLLPPDRQRAGGRFDLHALRASYAPIRSHLPTRRLLGVTVLRAVWMLGLVTYTGAYLRDALELSAERVGLYYLVSGIGSMVGSIVGSSRLAAASPRRFIATANVAGGLFVALVLLSPVGWVMAFLAIAATLGVAASVSTTALIAIESPAQPGTTMVLNSSMLNVGAAVGAAIGGLLIALGGYHALALGLPVFALGAAALILWPSAGT